MDKKIYSQKVSQLEREADVILRLDEPMLHKAIEGIGNTIKNSQETTDQLMEQIRISGNKQDIKDYQQCLTALVNALTNYHQFVYSLLEKRRVKCYAEIEKLEQEFFKQQVSSQ